ncbi:N-acetylornithine carbamoyltransferase [Microscilla marina]|uniref:N-succinylornithine carbamoyltransferase n=1 Tax=Microscilla marina ATCC 23134 TaxID=313606 RepID=A1ZXA8_MICM2|nr:N-acetylornithine carbamoyltransferase [Microscilla marina]EAY24981.1 ornithine carbamoyltransferase [Microscilla marina ATCC 23134]
MKHFITSADTDSVPQLVQKALDVKRNPRRYDQLGRYKTLGLLFFNPSLRTRLSTQKAAQNLGMSVMVMNFDKDGWQLETEEGIVMNGGNAEHVKEAAAVIGQYCDIVGLRTFARLQDAQADYEEKVIHQFRQYAGVPVVSLESEIRHPLQSLTDLLTIEYHRAKAKLSGRPKVVLSWAPHIKALPQAVANSFLEWTALMDYEVMLTHPTGAELSPEFTQGVTIEYDQKKALKGADFVYIKNWSSFSNYGQVIQAPDWKITQEKMALTNRAKLMHCLPVRRNLVIDDAVLDSAQSIVIEQAGNRETAAQTVLIELLKYLQTQDEPSDLAQSLIL